MPFPDANFDTVFSSMSLFARFYSTGIKNSILIAGIREIKRVLKPGGIAYIGAVYEDQMHQILSKFPELEYQIDKMSDWGPMLTIRKLP